MIGRALKDFVKRGLESHGYRVIRKESIPYGNLGVFMSKVAARGFRPTHVLDVGANKGDWSREVRAVFPEADFTLVEPQAELKPLLDGFCAGSSKARWVNAGAGAEPGELLFTVFPDTVSSSFAVTSDQAREWGLKQRSVPVITLDQLCREHIGGAIPQMVMLDVEGFEFQVLQGARSLIGKTEMFLLELGFLALRDNAKPFHEMVGIMAGLGYYLYDFTTFQARPRDGALAICEAAFVKDGGVLRENLGWN